MAKNYYEILGIELTGDVKIIKDAYTKKLRLHANDATSEVFQLIQEAYATLNDVKKKQAHDTEVMYGPKIERLREQASEAREERNYERAHEAYQQLLEYFPYDDELHNYNGIALDAMGQHKRAIESFEHAIELDSNNGLYYMNLALLYEDLEEMQKAIRYFKQAILVQPKEFEYVNKLANVYMRMEDYDYAWQFIEKALKKAHADGIGQLLYIKKLIEIAVVMNGAFEMKIALKYVEKFAAESDNHRQDTLEIMYNFCIKLADKDFYRQALDIANVLKKIAPSDQDIEKLYRNIEADFKLEQEFELLTDDEEMFGPLIYRVYLYYYYDEVEDADQKTDEVNERIWEAIEYESYTLKSSIHRLKRHYPTIAEGMKKWLDVVEKEL